MRADTQKPCLLARGRAGFNRILRLPQGGHLQQVVGRCDLGEVGLQVVRRTGRVDEAVFALQRDAVLKVHDARMEHGRIQCQAESLRDGGAGAFLARQVHDGVVTMPARGNFLVQVADGQRR